MLFRSRKTAQCRRRRGTLHAVACVWVVMTLAGLMALWNYSYSKAGPVEFFERWPSDSRIPRPHGTSNLVVFIHPRCPCSIATLVELARIQNDLNHHAKVNISVVMWQPVHGMLWSESAAHSVCRNITSATVINDRGGIEAKRFTATASGTCFLFDEDGRLQFCGGLTQSRGHVGESLESNILLKVTQQGRQSIVTELPVSTPVYGCSLFASSEQQE